MADQLATDRALTDAGRDRGSIDHASLDHASLDYASLERIETDLPLSNPSAAPSPRRGGDFSGSLPMIPPARTTMDPEPAPGRGSSPATEPSPGPGEIAASSAPAPSKSKVKWISLSERELQIVDRVAAGLTNQEIADQLDISKRTVDNHISNILTKTKTDNRVTLVRWALQWGKVCLDEVNCCRLPDVEAGASLPE